VLPVEVVHGKPAFLSCLAAAPAPSWREHLMVLQSVREAAACAFSPSLRQLVLQRRYALPMGECETWAVQAAGETAAAFQ